MRKFWLFIFFIVAGGIFAYNRILAQPCARPLEYSIGTFDAKFGIDREQFLADIKMGERVWEKAAGKDLFNYSPDAGFKVNLIYDERQRAVISKQRTESGLQAAEDAFRSADQKFAMMKASYEARSAEYESRVARFKKDQATYEAEIAYWNSQGGAKPSDYRKMEEERQRLNAVAQMLNSEAAKLNQASDELNNLLKLRNEAAKNYNALVQSYNAKYASGLEFDQAEYRSGENEINVYEFKTRDDLRLALAHELGHALGLDHVENSASVMYYMSGGQGQFVLSAEDLAELRNVCHLK